VAREWDTGGGGGMGGLVGGEGDVGGGRRGCVVV